MKITSTITPTENRGYNISEHFFGVNTLYHLDNVISESRYSDISNIVDPSFIRFPGGTITEEYFDLENPNVEISTNIIDVLNGKANIRSREVSSLSDFLADTEARGAQALIVLPTYRYFDQSTGRITAGSENIVKQFVVDVMSGVYGDADVIGFEIGNEWYQNRFRWTAEQYGELQAVMARWIHEALTDLNPSERPGIYVQAGQTLAEDDILSSAFSAGDESYYDGVIVHLYATNSTGNPLAIGGAIQNRLEAIHANWSSTVNSDPNLIISEWNVGEDGPLNTDINGIMRFAPLLRVFTEMVKSGVDVAALWTLQARGPAGISTFSDEGPLLTPTGQFFDLLSDSLADATLMELSSGFKLKNAGGEGVGYKYLFENDTSQMLFLASGSEEAMHIELDVTNLVGAGTYIYLAILGAAPGDTGTEYDSNATIRYLTDLDISETANGSKFLSVSLDAFELISINFIEAGGVELTGDAFFEISDCLTGSASNDTLSGGAGDDMIFGASGDDVIFGDHGDDKIQGGNGRDSLNGGSGADSLYGGNWHDTIVSGLGNDSIEGGSGRDLLDYDGALSGVEVNMNEGSTVSFGSTDVFTSIEQMRLSPFSDTVLEGQLLQSVELGRGNDFLEFSGSGMHDTLDGTLSRFDGGQGYDTISYTGQFSGVSVFVAEGIIESDWGNFRFVNFEKFEGSAYDDRVIDFVGGGGANSIKDYQLLGGNDSIYVYGGTQYLIDGGDGKDFIWTDGTSVEVYGGRGDDTIFCYGSVSNISGGDGDDLILGGLGRETISGGRGDDTLQGGGGSDIFVFEDDFGRDLVTDFSVANDVIDLTLVSSITSYSDLLASHLRVGSESFYISDGEGSEIELTSIEAESLNEDNFIFSPIEAAYSDDLGLLH